jgi:hypothetical protein
MSLERARDWIRRLGGWLFNGRHLWGGPVGVFAAVGLCALLPWGSEIRIRYAGLFLELAGIVTVAVGLQETRTLFNRSTFLRSVAAWVGSFPRWRVEQTIVTGAANIQLEGVNADAHGAAMLSPNATIEERLAHLQAQVQILGQLAFEMRMQFDAKFKTQEKVLDAERRERNDGDAGLHKLIDEAVAGGLTLEAMGLVWLVAGLVLSTASTEIAKLF